MLAVILPLDEKPGRAAVKITRDWYAPVGGILIAGAGLYWLIGFPLDGIWHRLFGQDVTLWGPTHLMLIGGAGLSLIGVLLLELEGRYNRPDPERIDGRFLAVGLRLRRPGDRTVGVPGRVRLRRRAVPAGAATDVDRLRRDRRPDPARVDAGPYGTLLLVAFAFCVRYIVAVLVGTGFEAPRNVFPLYLGAAIVVELLAVVPLIRRPLWWGALTGLGGRQWASGSNPCGSNGCSRSLGLAGCGWSCSDGGAGGCGRRCDRRDARHRLARRGTAQARDTRGIVVAAVVIAAAPTDAGTV